MISAMTYLFSDIEAIKCNIALCIRDSAGYMYRKEISLDIRG